MVSTSLNPDGTFPQVHCECCKKGYATFTVTANYHRWTKKEITEEIIRLGDKLLEARWYERGDIRQRLKHWYEKLRKYEEAIDEFDLHP